jgi:coenzyme PQQ precursor peptide PqqA
MLKLKKLLKSNFQKRLAMDCQKRDRLTLPETNSRIDSAFNPSPADSLRTIGGKPVLDWEKPDFEEFDLCMEVTAYVYHWQ